jgi:hypothetical protein
VGDHGPGSQGRGTERAGRGGRLQGASQEAGHAGLPVQLAVEHLVPAPERLSLGLPTSRIGGQKTRADRRNCTPPYTALLIQRVVDPFYWCTILVESSGGRIPTSQLVCVSGVPHRPKAYYSLSVCTSNRNRRKATDMKLLRTSKHDC